MSTKNTETEGMAIIDPSRFPKTPPLSAEQVQRLSEAVAECERGDSIDADTFLSQIPE